MSFAIRSITAPSSVTVNVDGRLIPPGADLGAGRTPAAFIDDGAGQPLLTIEFSGGEEAAGQLTLEGRNAAGRLLWKGAVTPTADGNGRRTADATLVASDPPPAATVGPVDWVLCGADGAELGRQSIEMEFYVLPPTASLAATPRGLPIGMLRGLGGEQRAAADVEGPAGLVGDPVSDRAWRVFNRNPPRYDIWQGAPHFVTIFDWNNITFHDSAYQAAYGNPNAICNCYDTAAYLQVLLRGAGYQVFYCYMQPFGYLALTNLIGRGQCNNPFYAGSNTPAVIGQRDPRRTAFNNHAFCQVVMGPGYISDGCAGPHIGNEYDYQYVASATDGTFPNPPRVNRGTSANIARYRGVTRIDALARPHAESIAFRAVSALAPPGLESNANAFLEAIGYADAMPTGIAHDAAAGRWPDPARCPLLTGWEPILDDLSGAFPESRRQWLLQRESELLAITAYVSSDGDDRAFARFVNLGSLSQSSRNLFERGPEDLGRHLAAFQAAGRQTLLWTSGNAAILVSTSDDALDLAALARWIEAERHSGDSAMAESGPPRIAEIVMDEGPVAVGATIEIEVRTQEANQIHIALDNDGLMLVAQEGRRLRFLARRPGATALALVAVDRETLLADQVTVTVSVRAPGGED